MYRSSCAGKGAAYIYAYIDIGIGIERGRTTGSNGNGDSNGSIGYDEHALGLLPEGAGDSECGQDERKEDKNRRENKVKIPIPKLVVVGGSTGSLRLCELSDRFSAVSVSLFDLSYFDRRHVIGQYGS